MLFGPLKSAINQAINTGFFGADKKSHQREALFYINSHYLTGDQVYVYRNDVPGYTLYKKMYPLKFDATIGNDYRTNSNSFDEYFSKISKDLLPFRGNKRVWIVFNGWMDQVPGDSYDQPAWYYKNWQNVARFESWLLTQGTLKDKYDPGKNEPDDLKVRLMDFSNTH
jgi:hypothetical protein